MSEDGEQSRKTIWKEVTEQISDHIDLAALELRYEARLVGRRLVAAAVSLILALTGFIVLQVALIRVLMRAGLPMGRAAG